MTPFEKLRAEAMDCFLGRGIQGAWEAIRTLDLAPYKQEQQALTDAAVAAAYEDAAGVVKGFATDADELCVFEALANALGDMRRRTPADATAALERHVAEAVERETARLRGAMSLLLAEVESLRADVFHCCTVDLTPETLKGDDKMEVERLDEMIVAARAALSAPTPEAEEGDE